MDADLIPPARAMQIRYEMDGPLYTTFVVAVLAGISVAGAAELAWGSQIPDANHRFTAVSAAWNSRCNRHSPNIMQTLHSLHGGDVQAIRKRRHDLKVMVSTAIAHGEPSWQVGLMVHAFGDSYAHTHFAHGTEESYGIPFDHGYDGNTPDQIRRFPQKYLLYVDNLYEALGGPDEPATVLARLRGIVEGAVDIGAGIAAYAVELGMSEDLSRRVCERLLAQVSESDVNQMVRFMQDHFRRM